MNTNSPLVLLRWSFGAPLGSLVAREMEGSSKGHARAKHRRSLYIRTFCLSESRVNRRTKQEQGEACYDYALREEGSRRQLASTLPSVKRVNEVKMVRR